MSEKVVSNEREPLNPYERVPYEEPNKIYLAFQMEDEWTIGEFIGAFSSHSKAVDASQGAGDYEIKEMVIDKPLIQFKEAKQ